jgi:hypothetical protein
MADRPKGKLSLLPLEGPYIGAYSILGTGGHIAGSMYGCWCGCCGCWWLL